MDDHWSVYRLHSCRQAPARAWEMSSQVVRLAGRPSAVEISDQLRPARRALAMVSPSALSTATVVRQAAAGSVRGSRSQEPTRRSPMRLPRPRILSTGVLLIDGLPDGCGLRAADGLLFGVMRA